MSRLLFFLILSAVGIGHAAGQNIWTIGRNDNSPADLALGPADYKKFLSRDFGFEDRYFLIGTSKAAEDFPYVLPGPDDTWGGTWGTSGWRTHEINILFGVKSLPAGGHWKLVIDLVDTNPRKSLLKVGINEQQYEKFLLKGVSDSSLTDGGSAAREKILEIPLRDGVIHKGGNGINITVLEGSWVVFDEVHLEGPNGVALKVNEDVFIRSVKAADYELRQGKKDVQPLLVDVEHLNG
ncbi:MAG TPA: polysaccharide lyase family protein, partial [Chryseosolibacter sp.]|nr:polysaccharide lyase family protein [Chryseosolibacter sp.]